MRTKKRTKLPRSIRYLLSADQRLRKISLKKISERSRTAGKPRRPRRAKTAVTAPNAVRLPGALSPRALALGLIPLVAAATLFAANQPTPLQPSAPAEVAHAALEAAPVTAPAPRRLQLTETTAASGVPHATRIDVKTPVVPKRAESAAPAAAPATPAATAATADIRQQPSATISGCLERDDRTFWLTETSGDAAPKSRSWRSGFLKKRASRIELADATRTLGLASYVGHRVSATGVLVERELQARSVRRLASTCS